MILNQVQYVHCQYLSHQSGISRQYQRTAHPVQGSSGLPYPHVMGTRLSRSRMIVKCTALL